MLALLRAPRSHVHRARAALQIRSRLLTSSTSASAPEKSDAVEGSKITAQIFIDLNWMEKKLLYDVAEKRFGSNYLSSCTVDAAPLRPFLQKSATEALGRGPVEVLNMYAYASTWSPSGSSNKQDAHLAPRKGYMDVVRALTEEGVAVRAFSSYGANVTAACSLTADVVHSCAIRGDVDTGTPLSSVPPPVAAQSSSSSSIVGAAGGPAPTAHGLHLSPTNMVIIAGGSPQYFPAVVRAAQHGRYTALASTKADWGRMAQPLAKEIADVITPVMMDDVLAQMVVPLTSFRAGALTPSDLARAFHSAVVDRVGVGSTLTGAELAVLITQAGLLKELRRADTTLRSIVTRHSDLFDVVQNGLKWTASAKHPSVTAVITASTATGEKQSGAAVGASDKADAASATPESGSPSSNSAAGSDADVSRTQQKQPQQQPKQQQQQKAEASKHQQQQKKGEAQQQKAQKAQPQQQQQSQGGDQQKKQTQQQLQQQQRQQQQQQQKQSEKKKQEPHKKQKGEPQPQKVEAEISDPAVTAAAPEPVVEIVEPAVGAEAAQPIVTQEEAPPSEAALEPAQAPTEPDAAPAAPELPPAPPSEPSAPAISSSDAPSSPANSPSPFADVAAGTTTSSSSDVDAVLKALLDSAKASGAIEDGKVKISNLKALLKAGGVHAPSSAKLDALKALVVQHAEQIRGKAAW